MPGSIVTFYTYFHESDIVDGDYPRDDVERRAAYDLDVDEAVRIHEIEGVTFEACGGGWAVDPDGSRILDYGNLLRVETSVHLGDDWPEAERAEIMERVG